MSSSSSSKTYASSMSSNSKTSLASLSSSAKATLTEASATLPTAVVCPDKENDQCRLALREVGKVLYSTFDAITVMIEFVLEKFPFIHHFRMNMKYIKECIFEGFPEESHVAREVYEKHKHAKYVSGEIKEIRNFAMKDFRRMTYILGVVERNCYPDSVADPADAQKKRARDEMDKEQQITHALVDDEEDPTPPFVPKYDKEGIVSNLDERPKTLNKVMKSYLPNGEVKETKVKVPNEEPPPPSLVADDEEMEDFFKDEDGTWKVAISQHRIRNASKKEQKDKVNTYYGTHSDTVRSIIPYIRKSFPGYTLFDCTAGNEEMTNTFKMEGFDVISNDAYTPNCDFKENIFARSDWKATFNLPPKTLVICSPPNETRHEFVSALFSHSYPFICLVSSNVLFNEGVSKIIRKKNNYRIGVIVPRPSFCQKFLNGVAVKTTKDGAPHYRKVAHDFCFIIGNINRSIDPILFETSAFAPLSFVSSGTDLIESSDSVSRIVSFNNNTSEGVSITGSNFTSANPVFTLEQMKQSQVDADNYSETSDLSDSFLMKVKTATLGQNIAKEMRTIDETPCAETMMQSDIDTPGAETMMRSDDEF